MVKEITVRELRQLLFNVKDQEMTVADLRRLLFDEQNQEASAEMIFHI
jgi:hypothetical protein